MLALTEFSLQYVPAKGVKGQVLANFLIEHPNVKVETSITNFVALKPWK